MMKQYGIDPRLVIWIQRNTGHDLQTFSDLARIKYLDSRKRNYSAAKKIDNIKHTEMLEQLSCCKEIKEEKKEEPKEAEQPCAEIKNPAGPQASSGPLHLGDTAHLSIDGMGIVLFSAEVMKSVVPGSNFLTEEFTDPQQVGAHIRKGDITAFCTGTGGDFALWFRSGYPDSNVEKEFPVMIRLALKVRGGPLQFCDLFWLSDWSTDFPKDQVLSLPDGYYHITACTRRPESGYWGDDQIICLYFNKLEEMPKLSWPGVPYLFTEQNAETQETDVQGPNKTDYLEMIRQLYGVEELQGYTEDELETVRSGLEKQPFGLYGWLGMDMSFYSNASDNMAVIMDCGDLELLYGAASEAGYEKLMEVLEGIGEAL